LARKQSFAYSLEGFQTLLNIICHYINKYYKGIEDNVMK